MTKTLNGVDLIKGGTEFAYDLEKAEADMKVKHAIYELATQQQLLAKRLDDCIKTVIEFSQALYAIGMLQEQLEDKVYRKEHPHTDDNANLHQI